MQEEGFFCCRIGSCATFDWYDPAPQWFPLFSMQRQMGGNNANAITKEEWADEKICKG
jgi:hypothetical protein